MFRFLWLVGLLSPGASECLLCPRVFPESLGVSTVGYIKMDDASPLPPHIPDTDAAILRHLGLRRLEPEYAQL